MEKSLWSAGIRGYWENLDLQQAKQGKSTGVKDSGRRSAVTGGKQMDALQDVVAGLWKSDPDISVEVRTKAHNQLPAYFRAAKNWDLIVLHRGALVAAMEFKSQRGPSFGNNFNNRTEESLGLAADSQKAAEKGLFGSLKPWFGFFMLVEEAPGSTSPVRVPSKMPFPTDPIFHDTSYIDRYRIFFERMVAEKNYDAVALLTATAHQDSFHEPSAKLSTANLVAEIQARITYIKNLPNEIFDELAMS